MARSFPNPVPDGTRVPAWPLVDVTARQYFVLRKRTHGQFQIVGDTWDITRALVGSKSCRIPSSPLTPLTSFIDDPEAYPGTRIGG